MPYLKSDDVVAIGTEEGFFHIRCYDENIYDLFIHNIVTEDELVDGDWYFCDKCEMLIIKK